MSSSTIIEFNSLRTGFEDSRVPAKRHLYDFSALKIPPYLPLSKGGDYAFPLRKRGMKGDFMVILLISWVLQFTFSKS